MRVHPIKPINPLNGDAWVVKMAKSNPVLMGYVGGRISKAGKMKEGSPYPILIYSGSPLSVDKAQGGQPRLLVGKYTIRVAMREDYLPTKDSSKLAAYLCPQGDQGIVQEIQRTFVGVIDPHPSSNASGLVLQSDLDGNGMFVQEYTEGKDALDVLEMGIQVLIYST